MSRKSKAIVRIGILALVLMFTMVTAVFAVVSLMPPVSGEVGQSEVSTYSGGMSTSIPISAPAGIGGLTPQIALTYSSVAVDQGGDSTKSQVARLGKGWSLSGLVSIQRDGWGEDYYLVMGGTREKLILGSNGYYHTKNESFSRIKKEKTYWRMWTKDGTYYVLGSKDASNHWTKQYKACLSTLGSTVVVYSWDVDSITDIYGNKISFTYAEIKYPGSVGIGFCYNGTCCNWNSAVELSSRVVQISYSRGGGNNVTIDFAAEGTCAYKYTCDGACWPSYYSNTQRYTSITVNDGTALMRKYVLNYSGAANTNYDLKSVTIYSSDGTSAFPVTTYSYTGHLLTQVNNGTGGIKQYTYGDYTLNTKNRHRVTKATTLDGMGNTYDTTYAYGTPVWNKTAKEFWGHSWVKTINAAGHYTQTWFYQDAVKQGRAYQSEQRDASNKLYSKSVSTYTTSNPYTGVNLALLSQQDNYLCDGDATCKHTQTKYAYDAYANVTKVSNMGDVAVSGDELYAYTEYINDTTNWRLGIPKHSYTKKSDDITKVAESWNYYSNTYNGAIDYGISTKYPRKTEVAAVFGSQGNAANPTSTRTYDQYGNVISTTDALGNTGTIAYDSVYHLFPISATNALGHTAYTYYYGVNAAGDSGFTGSGLWGQVKSTKDINGHFARTKYDTLGRPIASWNEDFSETYPQVSMEYAFWTSAGSPNKVVKKVRKAADSAETYDSYAYSDGLGRTLQTQTPSEEAGKMMVSGTVEYNILGQVSKTYIGYKTASTGAYISAPTKVNPTTYTYDPVGRVTQTFYPDGTNTRTFYNKYVTTAVDANNKQVRTTVDAYGRVMKKESFIGSYPNATLYATTAHSYDPLGRLVRTTDNVGNVNTFTYDNLGRKTAMTDMDMGTWTYGYDILGRLINQRDNKGQTVKLWYDSLSRIVAKGYPDGTATWYYYDSTSWYPVKNSLGKLIYEYSTATGGQPVSNILHYDSMGRPYLTYKTIEGISYASQMAYDTLGRVTVATYPDKSKVYNTYNPNNGALSKIGSTSGGDQYLKGITYNDYGLPISKTLGNNVIQRYTYNPNNFRVTRVTGTNSGGQAVQDLSYNYMNGGIVTGIADNKNGYNWSYTYDDGYRLINARRGYGTTIGGGTEIFNKSYAYNTIGNITNFEGAAYTYGDASHKHAVTVAGANTYNYDANGNMLTGAGRSYTWNFDNKPTSITNGGLTTTFSYGTGGERVKKQTGGNWKIYVGSTYEKDQTGKPTIYIDAAGTTVKKKSDGSLFFVLKDHLGGTSTITNAAGAVVTQQYYQPYGKDDINGSFENEADDHKFTGQEEDTETGLYNYNARLYDPTLGRFISADPVEGLNRYSYALNDPVNVTDPTGYETVEETRAAYDNKGTYEGHFRTGDHRDFESSSTSGGGGSSSSSSSSGGGSSNPALQPNIDRYNALKNAPSDIKNGLTSWWNGSMDREAAFYGIPGDQRGSYKDARMDYYSALANGISLISPVSRTGALLSKGSKALTLSEKIAAYGSALDIVISTFIPPVVKYAQTGDIDQTQSSFVKNSIGTTLRIGFVNQVDSVTGGSLHAPAWFAAQGTKDMAANGASLGQTMWYRGTGGIEGVFISAGLTKLGLSRAAANAIVDNYQNVRWGFALSHGNTGPEQFYLSPYIGTYSYTPYTGWNSGIGMGGGSIGGGGSTLSTNWANEGPFRECFPGC